MIVTYSYKKDGNKLLSENFKVGEFKCNDNSDTILIDSGLIKILQQIRNNFGKPVEITSGYRTKTYNTRIGGATNSQHVKGTASDIYISTIDPLEIALYAENIMQSGGIGLYKYSQSGFTHIDNRISCSRWIACNANGSYDVVPAIMPTLYKGDCNKSVVILQRCLDIKADGIFGNDTYNAVKYFQKTKGLVTDGICGRKTWVKIYG